MTLHYIKVEASRRVREPFYGPEAYRRSSKQLEFPFGKDQKLKTGKEAYQKAAGVAESLLDQSSEVSIWRMHGGSGTGNYLKQSDETFDTGWEQP